MKRSSLALLVAVLFACGIVACKGKPQTGNASSSALTDLSSSLETFRTAFNARKEEARFLTLLSPV